MSRNRFRYLGVLVLALLACASATAAPLVNAGPAAVTTQGGIFLLDGQPFFPVLGQVRKCPDLADPVDPSKTIADDMASIGVNILCGPAEACGPRNGASSRADYLASAVQTLHTTLSERMGWLQDTRSGFPTTDLPALLPELVDWQTKLTYILAASAGCNQSSMGLYTASAAAAKNGPAVPYIQIGTTGTEPFCTTPDTIENNFWTALIAHAKGIAWITINPRDATITDFSVPEENRAEAAKLANQLDAWRPIILANDVMGLRYTSRSVRAAAWQYEGSEYVAAVNTSDRQAPATFRGLRLKRLVNSETLKPVKLGRGSFRQSFGPLEVRLYKGR